MSRVWAAFICMVVLATGSAGATSGPSAPSSGVDRLAAAVNRRVPLTAGAVELWSDRDGFHEFALLNGHAVELVSPDPSYYEFAGEMCMSAAGQIAVVAVDPWSREGGIYVTTADGVWQKWSATGDTVLSLSFDGEDAIVGVQDWGVVVRIARPAGSDLSLPVPIYDSDSQGTYLEEAVVSPDGRIAVSEQDASDWQRQRIRLLNSDGTVNSTLPWLTGLLFRSMRFSSDGSQLMYMTFHFLSAYETDIRVCDPAVGYGEIVDEGVRYPTWLPDGGRAASQRIEGMHIWGRVYVLPAGATRQSQTVLRSGVVTRMYFH